MRLRALRRQWDGFGRTDPLWAVLTLPEKRGGRWDPEEFFRTGEEEVARILEGVRRRGVGLRRDRALDFGCGVGRITQALVPHFEQVVGVDIAPSMIALAEGFNRHPGRCHYHLNTSPHLREFPTGSFSFVFSHLVLQHIAPRYSRRYVKELVRVLAPGGLAAFNIPTGPLDSRGPRTRPGGPLPRSAFRARIVSEPASLAGRAGQPLAVKAIVRNLGDRGWPALAGRAGRYQINLGGRWLDAGGRLLAFADARHALPHDVAPNAEVELTLDVTVPATGGDYVLDLDLVQEGWAWFSEQGSKTARIPVRVEGPHAPSIAALRADRATVPVRPRVPFRVRHTRLHRLINPDGIRRLVHRVRQFTLWNVTIPVRRLLDRRRMAAAGHMEMHGLPLDEVRRLIQEAGGTVLDAEAHELTGAGWHSYWYWVRR